MPSGRSLALVAAIIAAVAAGYAVARQTSLFAIRSVELRGAPPGVAAQVRQAVADWRGTSLVGLDAGELLGRVDAVPWVVRASYDRAFPHTLRLAVQIEQPVAVLRAGRTSWLVSARGRVLARLPRGARPELPRVWVPAATPVEAGEVLPETDGGAAARSLAPLVRAHFPVRIASVTLRRRELVFRLAGGTELRLGRPDDLRLKLAVARRIVPTLAAGTGYVDVSVPERPVAGATTPPAPMPQVSG